MDYKKHYDKLIEKARSRTKPEGYTERHHIIPKCLGGIDDQTNIAVLTAREHFVAHLLLVKIYPENPSMGYSVSIMSGKHKRKIPSWWYEKAKEACLPSWKERGHKLGEEALEKGYLKL